MQVQKDFSGKEREGEEIGNRERWQGIELNGKKSTYHLKQSWGKINEQNI